MTEQILPEEQAWYDHLEANSEKESRILIRLFNVLSGTPLERLERIWMMIDPHPDNDGGVIPWEREALVDVFEEHVPTLFSGGIDHAPTLDSPELLADKAADRYRRAVLENQEQESE